MITLGDLVPLTFDVTDEDGNPADAGAAVLAITRVADGVTDTPLLDHPSIGRYQVDYETEVAGLHHWTLVTTGANADVQTGVFDVRSGTSAIVSLDDMKTFLAIPLSDNRHDDTLLGFIEAATQDIEDHTGDIIVRREVTEHVRSVGTFVYLQGPDPELTGVVGIDGTVIELDTLTTFGRRVTGLPYGEIAVTYLAGPAQVSARHTLVARMIVQERWRRTQRGTMALTVDVGRDGEQPDPTSATATASALRLLGPPRARIA